MMRKLIAIMLITSMCLSVSVPAFAADVPQDAQSSVDYESLNWETVEVMLDDGRVVEIQVASTGTHGGGLSTRGLTPEYEVGTTRSLSAYISNDVLGAIGGVGTSLKLAAKRNLAQAATSAYAASALAIVLTVSEFLVFLASMDILVGIEGFTVTTYVEYTATYIHREGHYIYGWSITGVDVNTQ